MDRTFVIIGAILALVGVALGAFGAHGLEGRVDEAGLRAFETGVRYQMYHGLALLWIGWAVVRWPAIAPGAWLLAVGTVLFSGSLYLIVLGGTRAVGMATMVTPLGGLSLLAGWAVVIWGVWKR